jgi:hypothetical protein
LSEDFSDGRGSDSNSQCADSDGPGKEVSETGSTFNIKDNNECIAEVLEMSSKASKVENIADEA